MDVAVVEDPVIDLVGEDDKAILLGYLHNSLDDLLGINTSCRVVGVDKDNSLCLGCDLALHILEVRVPVRILVADIVDSLALAQVHRSSPQRIVRCRKKNLVPRVKESLHNHCNKLAHTVSDVDIINAYILDSPLLVICLDGKTCLGNTA